MGGTEMQTLLDLPPRLVYGYAPLRFGRIAQLVERRPYKPNVAGSSPVPPTPYRFPERDPQLRRLAGHALVHQWPLLNSLPQNEPGIYAVTGGRQTGKTTLLKQWMQKLLNAGVLPQYLAYLTGELAEDYHALIRLISDAFPEDSHLGPRFLIVDEIGYVRGWDRGIKYLADVGLLDHTVLLITGSDTVLIRDSAVCHRTAQRNTDYLECPGQRPLH